MKVLGTIVKTALSIAATVFMHPDGLGSALVAFAAVYGLITWYIFSFSNSDGMFVGNGLISMAFAMILNLGLPILILVAPMFILQAILPGEIGTIIYGIILSVACVGCLLSDIMHIVRVFKPDFLGGGMDVSDD